MQSPFLVLVKRHLGAFLPAARGTALQFARETVLQVTQKNPAASS